MKSGHVLSLVAISSLIALSGCADNNKVEATQEAATEDSAVAEVAAVEPVVAEEEVVVIEEVIVEEKNPPRFAKVTDYIALTLNNNWNWETLANTPDVKEWHNQIPVQDRYSPEGFNYYINNSLDSYGGVFAQGSELQPNAITINSIQNAAEYKSASAVYELEDIFKKSELTRVKSNCDEENDSLFSKRFYKWQKEDRQPLYVYAIREEADTGITTSYGIAKSFEDFYKPEYKNALEYLRSKNGEISSIICTFDI